MKTSVRINGLKLQVKALQSLGFAQKESIRMTARGEAYRIKKALPHGVNDKPLSSLDTSAADKRRKEPEQSSRPAPQRTEAKSNKKSAASPKSGKPYNPRKLILDYPNGKRFMYSLDQSGNMKTVELGQFATREMTIADWRKLQEHVSNHAAEQEKDAEKGENKQPATKADQKGKDTMQKSETSIASTWGRSRNFNDIKQSVVGVTLPEAPLQKASPGTFGKNALEEVMSAQGHGSLTGHQQAALRCGLPADHPGIETMTFDDMKQAAEQLRLDVANTERARLGLPPLAPETPKRQARKASWSSM